MHTKELNSMKRPIITILVIIAVLGANLFFLQPAQASTTQVFTATGTFLAPAGVTSVTVDAWAGGASGGCQSAAPGGGGGGGAFSEQTNIAVTPGNSYTVTVGTGGAQVGNTICGANTNGNNGNDSWFNTTGTVLAKGGLAGQGSSGNLGGAGGAAASGVGTTVFSGGSGATIGAGGGGAGTTGNGGNAVTTTGGSGASVGGGMGGNSGAVGSTNGGGGGSGNGARGQAGARGEVDVTYTPIIVNHALLFVGKSTSYVGKSTVIIN